MQTNMILVVVDGEPLRVTLAEAEQIADSKGLDLIKVSENVYKVMNHEKYLYDKHKKTKKQKQGTKEAQFNVSIATNDLKRKIDDIYKWLKHGDNVRVVVKLRGRENLFPELGVKIIQIVLDDERIQQSIIEIPTIKVSTEQTVNNILVLLRPR